MRETPADEIILDNVILFACSRCGKVYQTIGALLLHRKAAHKAQRSRVRRLRTDYIRSDDRGGERSSRMAYVPTIGMLADAA